MLSAIKEIGKLVAKKAYTIEEQIEGHILSIDIDIENSSYHGINIEDFDSKKTNKYLFRRGASRGNVPSPFAPLNIKEPQKTYKKIEGWLKQCNNIDDDILKTEVPFIKKAFRVLEANKKTIISEIGQKVKNLLKKRGVEQFLTLKINEKFLGEYTIFKKCFEHSAEIKRKKSASYGICSICGLTDKEVSARTEVFKFDSFDKPGFIAGGFDNTLTWKNFPVCLECKKQLECGRKFIDSHLNFKFYGLNYYLIPRLLVGSKDAMEDILNILSDTTKSVNLKERIKKRITNDDNEILEILADEKDVLTLNFLFLKKEQSAERILLLIEDVLPSRLRKIFETKDYVDAVFNEEFNFNRIKKFYLKSDNKYFLEIIDSIFKGRKLEFPFLMKTYMSIIRKEFINNGYFDSRVRDALMNTLFFENLGLILFEEVKNMEESTFEEIFKKYGKTFTSPIKRGLFLAGALTQMLLNKQGKERGAKPFMKRLKGLKMDERDIKAILPAVQNKLEEYNSFDKGKRLVAEEAYNYLFTSGDNWRLSVDEINFYFAGGMNLAGKIKDVLYAKGEKEIDIGESD